MPEKSVPDRGSDKSREELLAEIAGLPPSAFILTALSEEPAALQIQVSCFRQSQISKGWKDP